MDLKCREDNTEEYDVPDIDTITNNLTILLEMESTYSRPQNYIKNTQSHGMDASWRRRICEWMIHTGRTFDLNFDTIACGVHLMDQYLSVLSVDKIVLQLLSIVCLYIASKVHEHRPISMEEMDCLCQGKYPRHEMIKMEQRILHLVEWKLNPPTAIAFARDFISLEASPFIRSILESSVNDLLDVCLSEYSMMEYHESIKSLAALEIVCQGHFERSSPLVDFAFESLHFPHDTFHECVQLMNVFAEKLFLHPLDAIPLHEIKDIPRSTTPTGVEAPPHLLRDQTNYERHLVKKPRYI